MNGHFKELWVGALRSGNYEQARHRLKVGGAFCPLGVLADICGVQWGDPSSGSLYDKEGLTPQQVYRVVGLVHDDTRMSFPQIADWIEANL